jgi:hypothetical protein
MHSKEDTPAHPAGLLHYTKKDDPERKDSQKAGRHTGFTEVREIWKSFFFVF